MSEKTEQSEEQSAVKRILAFRFSKTLPRKRAGINPFPPSNVLGVQLALRGVQWFYCTASFCARLLYAATCASQSVCGHPLLSGLAEWPLQCP